MLALRLDNRTPRDGWRYYQKETGVLLKANSLNQLLMTVTDHRMANELPVEPGLDQEIMAFMCAQEGVDCIEKKVDDGLSINGVIQFTKILGETLIKGNKIVDGDEAERRAKICAGCSSNIRPDGCTSCGLRGIANMLSKFVGARQTAHDNQLNSCKHCGCLNKAQVWFNLESLQKHTSDRVNRELPSNCWKKR